jgi:hypothetical protein
MKLKVIIKRDKEHLMPHERLIAAFKRMVAIGNRVLAEEKENERKRNHAHEPEAPRGGGNQPSEPDASGAKGLLPRDPGR